MEDLNDQYFVWDYEEQDREGSGTALAVFRMNLGKLETIFNPGESYDPHSLEISHLNDPEGGDCITPTEFAIKLLKKRGVDEVITVGGLRGEFYGIPFGVQYLDDELAKDERNVNWFEFQVLDEQFSHSHYLLTKEGITVRYLNSEKREFEN
jgi:hypothetical protein